MIVPTIGRVVLVHRPGSDSNQPEPALITFVHSNTLINVGGFQHNGFPFGAVSVRLKQEDSEGELGKPYAEWMPYQKQVAAEKAPQPDSPVG